MKRPSFQFYPSDWLRDTALRTCSVSARGLWVDMLCFMHEGNPYGTLKVGNKVILPANLAVMVGATLLEIEGWLSELESAGVFDRSEDGAIQSRRMIRDEYLRTVRAAGGKLGGNPALKVGGKVGGRLTLEDNQKPTPSSSSSPSSSKKKEVALSDEAKGFAKWFYDLLEPDKKPTGNWRDSFAKTYDELTRIDGYTKDEIKAVCEFGTEDDFWKTNFAIPSYLRKKSKTTGLKHFVQIRNAMNKVPKTYTKPPVDLTTSKL